MGDVSGEIYSDLPLGRHIRLLYLAPGTEGEPVIANLSVFALAHSPPYEALSYVWGHSGDHEPIEVNSNTIHVTKNLKAALVRVRYADRPRVVWADAICINQRDIKERGHHVGFMGAIYSQAKRVLVYLGRDEESRAREVAELVKENHQLVSKYKSIEEMPILSPDDPVFNDPRWTAVKALTDCVWWTRTWVIQEVGLAKEPWVLYGDVEFGYRQLMAMATWIDRCAGHLLIRAGIEFNAIHMEWVDWSAEWEKENWLHDRNFLDLMNQGSWLGCADHRDHVYAMLGHRFAQVNSDGEAFVKPDYTKDFHQVFLELAIQLLKLRNAHRLLSAVEHNEGTIKDEFPSWVPYWTVQETMTNLGIYTGFPYNASAGRIEPPLIVTEENHLQVKGTILGSVYKTFKFTAFDLAEPENPTDKGSKDSSEGIFREIWGYAWGNRSISAYKSDYLTAFSLTLTAALSGYESAEDNLSQHQDNFIAYWHHQFNSKSVEPPTELQTSIIKGDHEKFWLDMRFSCTGRSFAFTENGYYILGPAIMESEDLCCVIFGANVPFILRKTKMEGRYKLVGEAYVHGIMGGETREMLENGRIQEDIITLC
ncbi:heterokaryon incompatibility protein-domain-containing protein [Bisporella sp. PMI_857]|nr:heterokaryon incompatibility protein-domain-containing protein [Bisporella sp. PMI_857]